MKAYRIKQWDECHETHESRKLTFCAWVPIPNKHDGLSFSLLKGQENRAELYCAWVLMLQIASKGRKGARGWLARNGRALSVVDMALMTGFPQSMFEAAIEFFMREEIAWLVQEDYMDSTGDLPFRAAPPAASAGVPACPAAPPAASAGVAEKSPGGEKGEKGEKVQEEGIERTLSHRGAGASSSSPSSPAPPAPEVPTLAEVLTFCAGPAGIDPEYGREFWSAKNEKPQERWYQKTGHLVDWRYQLTNWWPKDRESWAAKRRSKRSESAGSDISKKTAADRREEKSAREMQQAITVPVR
jgi:hypothetical protein